MPVLISWICRWDPLGVFLLDYGNDRACVAPHDPTVTGRVGQLHGQQAQKFHPLPWKSAF